MVWVRRAAGGSENTKTVPLAMISLTVNSRLGDRHKTLRLDTVAEVQIS
jgi:hypothetical protein